MEAAVRGLLPEVPDANVLVEPWGRNTSPCIALGAVEVSKRCRAAVMGVFPADHRVRDIQAFQAAVKAAGHAAKNTNAFVTIGIKPTRPETGFGYLEIGPEAGEWEGLTLNNVVRFREKPGPEQAEEFLKSGRYLWNSGMFVFTVDALKDAYRQFLPRTSEAIERLAQNPSRLHEEWGNMDATSIDYGIMERCRFIYTVPAELGWSDLGTWPAVSEEFPRVPGGRGVVMRAISKDSVGNSIYAPQKTVVLLGVQDLVVVDTDDALLVMHQDRSSDVSEIVRELDHQGLDELT
jgi:mannose-1-phosphate guanylyltransferase